MPEVWEFLRADDAELLPCDLEATRIHTERLREAGILTEAELDEVAGALGEITVVGEDDEDVYSAIERQPGEVGRKIHAGQSRNDQVAAAFRLYVGAACRAADDSLRAFARAILKRAADEAEAPMPGYTHLQRATP